MLLCGLQPACRSPYRSVVVNILIPNDRTWLDASVFEHANPAEINIFPLIEEEEEEELLVVTGTTYPWKDVLETRGFKYFNDEGISQWRAPAKDHIAQDLATLFDEYGFETEIFDGVNDDGDDE